jgi:hypothetical protein
MATTTNYGWTTPDDTALVKDGAAAIRTLGSSVDTTTKNLNPSTTLGDIEYRSSTANTNTRLGIGTTGQVLSVSGGVPAWATPATPVSGLNLITPTSTANSGGSVSTSGGAVTFSGVTSVSLNGVFTSSYANYRIEISQYEGSTAVASQLRLRASGSDTAGAGYYYSFARVAYAANTVIGAQENGGAEWWIAFQNNSSSKQSASIIICSPNLAQNTSFQSTYSSQASSGMIGGYSSTTTQFDGFTLKSDTGNTSGVVRVYGIQN